MKKLLMVLVLSCLILGGVFGMDFTNASPAIEGSSVFIDAGIGWALLDYSIAIPPISAAVTFKLAELPLSVGGYFAYTSYEEDLVIGTYSGTMMGFGARANWHFALVDALDTYVGVSLGWLIWNQEVEILGFKAKADLSEFLYGGVLGTRFFFTDNIGLYLEVGYSAVSVASAGLSLKF